MRLLYVRSTCRFFEMWFNHIEKIQFRTRSRTLSNFPIFRHQCRLLACFSFVVIVVCVRLHKSIKNYVRFCRNFVPTFVKMSSKRQKTDSILLSFFFHCLWHHPSNLRCEYATICFFVALRCVSHRPIQRSSASLGWNSIGSNFCPIKESTNWLCLCLTNQLNRIYLTMTRYFSCFSCALCSWLYSAEENNNNNNNGAENRHNLNGNYGFSFRRRRYKNNKPTQVSYLKRFVAFDLSRKQMPEWERSRLWERQCVCAVCLCVCEREQD